MRHILPLLALLASAPVLAAPVCDGAIADPARERSIPVRVRMPEGGATRAPVIFFSHGLGGSVEGGSNYGRAWAQAGFLVVHVQHPGSDSSVWQGSANPRDRLTAAASGQQLMDRVQDMRRLADALQAGAKVGACDLRRGDPKRLGAAGHSFGAHTVLALAGQKFGPLGARGHDPRFRAVAALSPIAPRNDPAMAPAAFGGITIPVFSATGSEDSSPFSKGKSLAEITAARSAVFDALPASQTGKANVGLWVEGADHAALSGGGGRKGGTPSGHTTALVSAATTAFFNANLGGNGVPHMQVARSLLAPGDTLKSK